MMENLKTQQFAKFYLKDLKLKSSKLQRDKVELSELNSPSAN